MHIPWPAVTNPDGVKDTFVNMITPISHKDILMSCAIKKTDFCVYATDKGADQLHNNCTEDQHFNLCSLHGYAQFILASLEMCSVLC